VAIQEETKAGKISFHFAGGYFEKVIRKFMFSQKYSNHY
jgi:hypothetical protein